MSAFETVPALAPTLAEVDKITEDLDQAITDLYTWRDACADEDVRDVLAAVGDALGAGWAALQHARTKARDLDVSLRVAPQAKSAEDADRQAVAALGERVRVGRMVRTADGAAGWVVTRGGAVLAIRATHAEAIALAQESHTLRPMPGLRYAHRDQDRAAGYL